MVQAMINISEQVNQVLNIVKAKHNFKDKSKAIEFVVNEYGEEMLEPELRPEYIEKMKKIAKEKAISYSSIEEFRKAIGLN